MYKVYKGFKDFESLKNKNKLEIKLFSSLVQECEILYMNTHFLDICRHLLTDLAEICLKMGIKRVSPIHFKSYIIFEKSETLFCQIIILILNFTRLR